MSPSLQGNRAVPPSPISLDKRRAVTALLAHARDLREQADALLDVDLDDATWEDAVRVHHELDMVRKTLGVVSDVLIDHVHKQWPGDWKTPHVVDGVGQVKPYRTPNRTQWRHDELVTAVVDANLQRADGEIPDPFTVARWIRETAGIARWKTGALRALGIDIDEYAETTPGRRTLQIVTNDTVGGES